MDQLEDTQRWYFWRYRSRRRFRRFDDDFSDDGFGDDSGDGEDGDQSKIKDPLADIEDSQKELVGDLRKNMSSFYKAREKRFRENTFQ